MNNLDKIDLLNKLRAEAIRVKKATGIMFFGKQHLMTSLKINKEAADQLLSDLARGFFIEMRIRNNVPVFKIVLDANEQMKNIKDQQEKDIKKHEARMEFLDELYILIQNNPHGTF